MTKEEKEKRAAVIRQVKEAYIAGTESLAALGGRWGVPVSTLRRRCAKEGWAELRRAWCAASTAGADKPVAPVVASDAPGSMPGRPSADAASTAGADKPVAPVVASDAPGSMPGRPSADAASTAGADGPVAPVGASDAPGSMPGRSSAVAESTAGADKLVTLMGVSDTLDTLLVRSCADMESRGAPIKEIKELTGTLKDAIAIKRELWSIPKNEGETQLTVRMAVPEEYFS